MLPFEALSKIANHRSPRIDSLRLSKARSGAPAQIAGYQHSAADPLEFQYLKFRCLMLNFEAFCYTSPFGLLGIPVELCGVPNVLRRI